MVKIADVEMNNAERVELKKHILAYKIGKKLNKKDKEITKKLLGKNIRMVPTLTTEIASFVEAGKPMLLARLGGTEGRVAGEYIERRLGLRKHYSESMINWLYTTSGFFADDYEDKEKAMDEYSELTLKGVAECDFLSAVFPTKDYMPFIFKHFALNAIPTFSDFGPYFEIPVSDTWVKVLKGKKVLVINSFTESIEEQYKRKRDIAFSPEYELPDFELLTYKSYVTQVGERPGDFKNSFEVIKKMTEDIKKIDFDIALIGAGAYGFPLAVEIKKMGKIVFETCGRTPLFFGIYGERDLRNGIEKYATDAWTRPLEEPPKDFKRVEGGCYW